MFAKMTASGRYKIVDVRAALTNRINMLNMVRNKFSLLTYKRAHAHTHTLTHTFDELNRVFRMQ